MTARHSPTATVVVLAWRWTNDIRDVLEGLGSQTIDDFDILVIDNGAGFEQALADLTGMPPVTYLGLPANVGAAAGRNAALSAASGEVLIFLDDDATPAPTLVAAHLAAYDREGVVATRGTGLPKTDRFLSRAAFNYDLGPEPIPAFLNTENNCSIRRQTLAEVGGFAAHLFGHEGNELSLRLIDRYGPECIWYVPDAMVRHDDYDSVPHYFKKNFRMGAMAARIDLKRVRRLRPAARPRSADPLSIPLRLVGKACELAGYAIAKTSSRLTRRAPHP